MKSKVNLSQSTNKVTQQKALFDNHELNRLLSAAVVNEAFCQLLLNDPKKALAKGYEEETFKLTQEEQHLVLSIQANSLTDFATQLTEHFYDAKQIPDINKVNRNNNGNGHGHIS